MEGHNKKVALFYKLRGSFMETSGAYPCEEITAQQWDHIQKYIAPTAVREAAVGFLDTSLNNSGKSGCLFTDEKIYYLETMEKPQKIWYDEIDHIALAGESNESDHEKYLRIFMKEGKVFEWQNPSLNKSVLGKFILYNLKIDQEDSENAIRIFYSEPNDIAATTAGLGASTRAVVNKSYEEERFHSRQGHGFAAERANTLYDRMTGHDAEVVGDDNAKNGADRIVDGAYIQSKYCQTGAQCINECFEGGGKGLFRYIKEGKPMEIEVPSDKYEEAVRAMEEKIRKGQVPGVSDEKAASQIVRKGHFTYQQAKNIAKAGTVESIAYDAASGAVRATSALGVSSLVAFATAFWNGEEPEVCLQRAAYSGLKVGGVTFLAVVLSGQLSKAGLNSLMVGSSEKLISILGPKASAILMNAFRDGGKAIYGAAAMKSAAKLLRGNLIMGTITFALLSSADIGRLFCGRISGEQLLKNLLRTAASVGGGTAGFMVGASVGNVIVPVVGGVVGGVVGATLAGSASEKAAHAVSNQFLRDDADKMAEILQEVFQKLSAEYLLNGKEAEKSIDTLSERLTPHVLRDMYASSDREQFAMELVRPIIENRVAKRPVVHLPSQYALTRALRTMLESVEESGQTTT